MTPPQFRSLGCLLFILSGCDSRPPATTSKPPLEHITEPALDASIDRIMDTTGRLPGRYSLHMDRSALVLLDTTDGTVYILNAITTNWTTVTLPKTQ